ncbi:hypothetical protein HPB50_003302 [Hyalomma asiaticum]|uniref:Uncharacterized protein n=1 Tax=Hyalomma asiaticum TaxID=266040 RepID=A0ACB7RTZ7_HYAAI|nr:hypothetical protein HPB50_003302 [Hyalomma asiaticum]
MAPLAERAWSCLKAAEEDFEAICTQGNDMERPLLDCVDTSVGDCNNSAEAKEFMMGRLEHIFGEALSLVCGSHTRGSASCAALPALPELEPGTPQPVANLVEYAILIMQLLGRR